MATFLARLRLVIPPPSVKLVKTELSCDNCPLVAARVWALGEVGGWGTDKCGDDYQS